MTLALTHSGPGLAQIETLVMPGKVIQAHAETESDCNSCHQKFERGRQRTLCLQCHEDVGEDIAARSGFHGRNPEARDARCASCHTDHEGRDADIVGLDEEAFDHEYTDFALIGAHLDAACGDCHAKSDKHRDVDAACIGCHRDDDVHEAALGTVCSDCHTSTEWQDATFDHDTTGYPLLGRHAETACLDCHADATYQNAPTACFGCHAEDDAHDGRSGQECESCHNPSDWHDTSFDHARDTDFPLVGRHAALSCDDCHSDAPFQDDLQSECVACHLDDDRHEAHNGDDCGLCHASDDWALPFFDHDRDTGYALAGAHREVACVACHVAPIFDVALAPNCFSCHAVDEPHEGTLGEHCENCHTEVSWQEPAFFDHDLTQFPLLGQHDQRECDDCHLTKAFAATDAECVSCHHDDDPHRNTFHDRCDACHNPVAWDIWLFDHGAQTAFPLEGGHIGVACAQCHRGPLSTMEGLAAGCGACHRADDVHDGEFGPDCGRCHTADSFTEVRALQ